MTQDLLAFHFCERTLTSKKHRIISSTKYFRKFQKSGGDKPKGTISEANKK